jgi:hypothetical protein
MVYWIEMANNARWDFTDMDVDVPSRSIGIGTFSSPE